MTTLVHSAARDLGILAVCLAVATSCKTRSVAGPPDSSGLHMDRGIPADVIPGVVRILVEDQATCTATAVSDRVLITAAHCFQRTKVESDPESASTLLARVRWCVIHGGPRVCGDQVYLPGSLGEDSQKWLMKGGSQDLAIGVLPEGTFVEYYAVQGVYQANLGLVLAGYGSSLAHIQDRLPFWLTLVGAQVLGGDLLSKGVFYNARGVKAYGSIQPGDSGGPALTRGCRLRGVASRVAPITGFDNAHVDLLAPRNVNWIGEFLARPNAPTICLERSSDSRWSSEIGADDEVCKRVLRPRKFHAPPRDAHRNPPRFPCE